MTAQQFAANIQAAGFKITAAKRIGNGLSVQIGSVHIALDKMYAAVNDGALRFLDTDMALIIEDIRKAA